jgi:hypothetical protein
MTKFTNIAYIRMGLSLLLYATITLKTEKKVACFAAVFYNCCSSYVSKRLFGWT